MRVPEPEGPGPSALRRPPPAQRPREEPRRNGAGPPPARRDGPYAPRRRAPEPAREPGGLLPRGITDALSGLLRGGLETEDLLLMLILYLMYRESGDKELLIVLGAMLLL